MSRSLFQKIWDNHAVDVLPDGHTLLYIDRHLFHEGSFHAFEQIRKGGLSIARPEFTFGFADHYVPTTGRTLDDISSPDIRQPVELFNTNAKAYDLPFFDMANQRQGIVHVAGPELGITLPGLTVVCGDSHTTTHGALGALAFGIGASEVAQVFATQTLWQARPRIMRVTIDGKAPAYVTPKDIALALLGQIGTRGALGHAVEFAGSAISSMTMEGRFTLCNMSVELGARAGLIAPDQVTEAFVKGRPYAPQGADFDAAVKAWRALATDAGTQFDREASMRVDHLSPMVTWGNSPDMVVPIDGSVPDPEDASSAEQRTSMQAALKYMGLEARMPVSDIRVDRIFIGSCTNARIEDLRAAAAIAKHGKAVVPALVSPGSTPVQRQAEAEGLHEIFQEAGFRWGHSGCSMCVGINGETVASGERCASTTNRNFSGRQGPGARTHLVSPVLAAAAALEGRLVHPRTITGQF
jgi:3-isopropylmalate/(R)-2-methylmalate dehydratase large subunit